MKISVMQVSISVTALIYAHIIYMFFIKKKF